MHERSPFWLLFLITVILFSSGLRDLNFSTLHYIQGLVSMVLFLFLIRLSDDICDIYIDKITHPTRLLCANAIAIRKLKIVRLILLSILLVLQSSEFQQFVFMSAKRTDYRDSEWAWDLGVGLATSLE